MEYEVVSTAAPMIGAITAAVAIFWFNIARSRAKEQAARIDMRLRGMEDTLRFILERQRSRRRSRYAEMVRADPVASMLLEEAADREVVELTLAPAYKVGDGQFWMHGVDIRLRRTSEGYDAYDQSSGNHFVTLRDRGDYRRLVRALKLEKT